MSGAECEASSTLHPALARRFSPLEFDQHVGVTDEHVDALLDAARLAPSAGNSQPWAFVVALRGDAVHRRLVGHLARSSSQWASSASLLVVNLAHVYVEDTPDWEYSEFARYDLGQAVAHMTIQGLAMGLDAHQFRAFDRAAVALEFEVPEHWEVASITAFGMAVPAAVGHPGSRVRRSRDDVTWARG